MNDFLEERSVEIAKGGTTSSAEFDRIRKAMTLEDRSDAVVRMKSKKKPIIFPSRFDESNLKTIMSSQIHLSAIPNMNWTKAARQLADRVDQEKVKQALNSTNGGKYLKSYYVNSLELFGRPQLITRAVSEIGGPHKAMLLLSDLCIKVGIQANKENQALLRMVLPYLYPDFEVRVRRRKKRFLGHVMPTLPSIKAMRKKIQALLFENVPLTDYELLQKFNNDAIYAGKMVYLTVPDAKCKMNVSVPLLLLDMRTVVAQHLHYLFTDGCFAQTLPDEVTIQLTDWIDGSNALKSPFVAALVNVCYESSLFKSTIHPSRVTVPLPVAFSFCPETINNVNAIRTEIGKMLPSLLRPLSIGEKTFKLKLTRCKGDNSASQKCTGNSVGGHCSCPHCGINFTSPDIKSWVYHAFQTEKSLQGIMNGLQSGKCIPGSQFVPGILPNGVDTNLADVGLSEYEHVPDPLHNCKGHILFMFEHFFTEPGFNKPKAFFLLRTLMGRFSFNVNMSGADWRFYIAKFEHTLLPCISFERERALEILRTWSCIQAIIYMNVKYRIKTRAMVIILHVLLFYHGFLCINRWNAIAKCLYFHNLWGHFGKYYETSHFADSSTEENEAQLAVVKKTLKDFTDRKKTEKSLTEITVRQGVKREISPTKNRNRNEKEERELLEKLLPSSYFVPISVVYAQPILPQWWILMDYLGKSTNIMLDNRDFRIDILNGQLGYVFSPRNK